jgi:hypothetical protein
MTDAETEAASNAKRTVTMTFRIDERTMDILKSESEQKEVSLNILINQILRRYVDWQMYEPKVGMITIARPVASALFERMSEADVTKMARDVGKNAVHDIALFMKGKMDLPSFMSWFESRMKISSIEFSHTKLSQGKHSYVMKHDLGYNWSLYHKTLLELIFSEILHRRADIAITATTMTLSFEE